MYVEPRKINKWYSALEGNECEVKEKQRSAFDVGMLQFHGSGIIGERLVSRCQLQQRSEGHEGDNHGDVWRKIPEQQKQLRFLEDEQAGIFSGISQLNIMS